MEERGESPDGPGGLPSLGMALEADWGLCSAHLLFVFLFGFESFAQSDQPSTEPLPETSPIGRCNSLLTSRLRSFTAVLAQDLPESQIYVAHEISFLVLVGA